MAYPLNRPAIFLDLIAFVLVSVFCISTEAPIMQQDILVRTQDALILHGIPIKGIDVSGRDVTLNGTPESAAISDSARALVEKVAGVRVVNVRVFRPVAAAPVGGPADHESQQKIDRLMDAQGIAFKAGSTALTPESGLVLDKVAIYLSEVPGLQCEIRGYDSQPQQVRHERVLALQRALATQEYLETKGISDARLSTHAFHIGEGTDGRRTDRPVDLIVSSRD